MAAPSLQSAPSADSEPSPTPSGEDTQDTRAALVVYKGTGPETHPGSERATMPEADERHTLAYGQEGSEPPSGTEQPESTAFEGGEPRRIGDFLVRRLIGEGGMGKVYEAEERLSRRRVALKVLRSELSRSEAGRRQFVNEMAILASLDDPHVVRCLHCTEVDGELVMALEYLEGETLRARMAREGALVWDEVVDIAWQIAAALAAAHGGEQPIIHRDLKPENVMLVDNGRVKVMDFGIAKVLQAVAGNTTHSVGTLQYMSPEQIDARPLDPRSDLYALGLLMWELLSGRVPFESESPRVLLDKLCTEPAPPLPESARRGLPRGVEQLVHQLLEKDPADRPVGAAEVLERLEPFRPAERSESSPSPAQNARGRSTESPARDTGGAASKRADTPAPALRPSSSGREVTPRFDTVAVLEQASAPRELPLRLALTIIISLSLTAGLVTWLIRALTS